MAYNFNLYENYNLDQFHFEFMGEFIIKNEKYFLSKKNVVWGYENREYVFVKKLENLTEEDINYFLIFSKMAMEKLVKVHENHMSTHITLFIECKQKESNITKKIKKIKMRKSYMWGLRGWSNLRIIIFDSSQNEFIFNKDSKEVINFYKGVLN